jgi:hypothetical protein
VAEVMAVRGSRDQAIAAALSAQHLADAAHNSGGGRGSGSASSSGSATAPKTEKEEKQLERDMRIPAIQQSAMKKVHKPL